MTSKIKNLPYFTSEQLTNFCNSKISAKVFASRQVKSKVFLLLKRGIRVHKDKIAELEYKKQITPYLEYITTNVVYTPSYLSGEYILFKHGILTENVYNITAITTKKTQTFTNHFGTFVYKTIKKDLFRGFSLKKTSGRMIYEASAEKALIDYFRLKKDIIREDSYFEQLRLRTNTLDRKLFESYCNKTKSKKIKKVFNYLQKIQG